MGRRNRVGVGVVLGLALLACGTDKEAKQYCEDSSKILGSMLNGTLEECVKQMTKAKKQSEPKFKCMCGCASRYAKETPPGDPTEKAQWTSKFLDCQTVCVEGPKIESVETPAVRRARIIEGCHKDCTAKFKAGEVSSVRDCNGECQKREGL
jgi:hypothetical protein